MNELLIAPLIIFFMGAFLCIFAYERPSVAKILGPLVAVTGSIAGLLPAVMSLVHNTSYAVNFSWNMPLGSFALKMDTLAALFALPVLFISGIAAVYGYEYLKSYSNSENIAVSWFFYNLLAGSMLLVIMANSTLLFLLAWEIMSLASFFLVIFENKKENVRKAGWIYLTATHIGTAFILVMFLLMGNHSGTFDFAGFSLYRAAPRLMNTIFIFAVIGFGAKAGFMPFHVWLPEAHPAAPSHVSAVMSGVMIKTGIYGLLRILTFLPSPPSWYGWFLLGIGISSGILGVSFALAQHDLKRLLAYHSVENIGIIAIGIGTGLLGLSYNHPVMAVLGFSGALLHVINHAIFKSLLFMGAGAVLHAAKTLEMDHLGGLLKRMPLTGFSFLVGSAAICGLPPLNGFVSEFMIYIGSLSAITSKYGSSPISTAVAGVSAATALAIIGGLAAACFTKAFGVVFLGEPRSSHAVHAHEAGFKMKAPMIILAAACLAIGLSGPVLFGFIINIVKNSMGPVLALPDIHWAFNSLYMVTLSAAALIVLGAIFAFIRFRLLYRRKVATSVTWDCGYNKPSPRMQYSSSSFADPIVNLFKSFLQTRLSFTPPSGLFPKPASFSSETPDIFLQNIYAPIFSAIKNFMGRLKWLQHGRLNFYILYIVIALVTLLLWKL